MRKKEPKREFKRQDIVDSIVKMRIQNMAATKTIIKDYLQDSLGYGQSYAYELYKEAREKIVEYYKIDNIASLAEAVGQLEEMAEDAKGSKNYKLAFEIRKELNKMAGNYEAQKIELSGNVSVIKLTEVLRGEDE